ncbi:MAG: hypothetical protein ACR2N3_10980 [Pyrinomonadaceae bacterium]
MTAKMSFAEGDEFYFYRESSDDNHVYLQLNGNSLEFRATEKSVTIAIPVAVWEVIKQTTVAEFDLTGRTDIELREIVEREVESRIAGREKRRATDEKNYFAALVCSPIYGMINLPRAEQIKYGMNYYRKERARQQNVLEQIKELQEANKQNPK